VRLFREVFVGYLTVVVVAALTLWAVVLADLAARRAGADQWARGCVAGCAGCGLLAALARARRSRP
jgi:hypothetical protein